MSKLVLGITGSFCNHKKTLQIMEELVKEGYELLPVLSECVYESDTRFFTAVDFRKRVEDICNHEVLHTIAEAETVVNVYRCTGMVILPCTANTLNKLAKGIYDTPVTLAAKSLLRNDHSVVIGFASNDGLSTSLENIGHLITKKNIFFIPFSQDDYIHKPYSLVCDFDKCLDTLVNAEQKRQIQPILLR